LGGKFDENAEFESKVSRFVEGIDDEQNVPAAVRAKGTTKWVSQHKELTTEESRAIQKKAEKAKRSRLAYAGLGW
jgi:metal-dependent amidase/aminoacylase/carboxypeptidase family protein